MRSFLREDRRASFDPACPPLARFTLLREVFEDYEALAKGRSWAPGAPAPSFREYVAWLHGQEERDARAFWEEALRGFPAPNEVSLERREVEPRERHRFRRRSRGTGQAGGVAPDGLRRSPVPRTRSAAGRWLRSRFALETR